MSEMTIGLRRTRREEFAFGRTVNRAFDVFGRGFGEFMLIVVIVLSPLLLLELSLGPVPAAKGGGHAHLSVVLLLPPLAIVAQAACLHGTFRSLRDESFSALDSLGVALRRFFPLLGVGVASVFLIALGLALLVVPGLIVSCMLYVAAPVCVVENTGVFESLGRSRRLTEGYRWSIFGFVLIVGVANRFVEGLAGADLPFVVSTLLDFFGEAFVNAYGAVFAGVVYHDLRAAKEGVDIEKLTTVFE